MGELNKCNLQINIQKLLEILTDQNKFEQLMIKFKYGSAINPKKCEDIEGNNYEIRKNDITI